MYIFPVLVNIEILKFCTSPYEWKILMWDDKLQINKLKFCMTNLLVELWIIEKYFLDELRKK